MDHDELYWTTEAMIRKGGGFVNCLAALIRAGNLNNQMLLINTFPEYWNTYKHL